MGTIEQPKTQIKYLIASSPPGQEIKVMTLTVGEKMDQPELFKLGLKHESGPIHVDSYMNWYK